MFLSAVRRSARVDSSFGSPVPRYRTIAATVADGSICVMTNCSSRYDSRRIRLTLFLVTAVRKRGPAEKPTNSPSGRGPPAGVSSCPRVRATIRIQPEADVTTSFRDRSKSDLIHERRFRLTRRGRVYLSRSSPVTYLVLRESETLRRVRPLARRRAST